MLRRALFTRPLPSSRTSSRRTVGWGRRKSEPLLSTVRALKIIARRHCRDPVLLPRSFFTEFQDSQKSSPREKGGKVLRCFPIAPIQCGTMGIFWIAFPLVVYWIVHLCFELKFIFLVVASSSSVHEFCISYRLLRKFQSNPSGRINCSFLLFLKLRFRLLGIYNRTKINFNAQWIQLSSQ